MKKILTIVFSASFLLSTSLSSSSAKLNSQRSTLTAHRSLMILTSPAFKNNGVIPAKYTCDGKNISPPLEWKDAPVGTKSFALIVDDPDAVPVAGFVWDHWILFNIPPHVHEIKEHSSAGIEGMTSFGKASYGGPCPPNGQHTYHFKLYALDVMLALKKSSSKKDLEQAMKDHILAEAELLGKYDRKKK